MSPAVQESKEFKHKIKELEKKIRDMTHTIEEWPREWQQNLLFHGVPVPDKESFYTKVWPPEVVILQGSPRPRWCLRLSGRRWESGGRSVGFQEQDLKPAMQVLVTGLTRLIPVEHEIGGWPPVSVSFQVITILPSSCPGYFYSNSSCFFATLGSCNQTC